MYILDFSYSYLCKLRLRALHEYDLPIELLRLSQDCIIYMLTLKYSQQASVLGGCGEAV